MDEQDLRAIIERFAKNSEPGWAESDARTSEASPPDLSTTPSAADLASRVAAMIDHTVLKSDATLEDVRTVCEEAMHFGFAAVCVNPCYARPAATWLAGSGIKTCTVVGFPLGASRSDVKVKEAKGAAEDGVQEIDMVLNVGMLKSGEYAFVEDDIRAVTEAVRPRGVLTKVILETALLTDEEKVIACVLARNAGAGFVKTSTGFARGGATAPDVALMRRVVGRRMGVKASGGVRTLEHAERMIASGATRIGASASVSIVQGRTGGADD